MVKFEVGKTYYTRSIRDSNCIICCKIEKRTEKTLTTKIRGVDKVFRIKVIKPSFLKEEEVESFLPWGNYSMCPVLCADDTKVLRSGLE